jgi:uncharacterized tellurite resistance protein B-like protein
MTYQSEIRSQEQAICHLFFHCCLKDGTFSDDELTEVSSKLVDVGLYKQLNFKDEIQRYKSYGESVINDAGYLEFLVKMITPVNTLALYSYCVELVLSDSTLSVGEEALLGRIAGLLQIEPAEQDVTKRLMAQRRVVRSENIV